MMKCGIANSHFRKIFQRDRRSGYSTSKRDRVVGAGVATAVGRTAVAVVAARRLPCDLPGGLAR